jgi:hypothetical protein
MAIPPRASQPSTAHLDTRTLAFLQLGLAALVLLWRTPVLPPIKVPLVCIHELFHGIGALLGGGSIGYIEAYPQESGMTFVSGGSTVLTYNAGYLGSLLLGVLLLISARFWLGRVLLLLLAGLVAVICLRFMPSGPNFGMVAGLASAIVLFAAALMLPGRLHAFLVRLLGLGSCCYPLLDITSDVLLGSKMRSDARMLGDLTPIPMAIWSAIWLVATLGAAGLVLWRSWRVRE